MGITIEEVAARVNLNKGSVSRILNGKADGYSAKTRQRVLETAAEMGYRPNALARALWTGSTNTVGLWLLARDSYSPYYGYIHHCLQRLSRQHNYQLITEDTPIFGPEPVNHTQPARWPVDGILSCDVTHSSASYPRSAAGRQCPVVCLGQGYVPEMDYVRVDLYDGAYQGVQHLIEIGCRRIAFVSEKNDFEGTTEGFPRVRAYLDALAQAGLMPEFIFVPEETRLGAYEGVQEYIQRNGAPDGVFCVDDEVAIGSYLAFNEQGIRVPNEVSIVGLNGLDEARLFPCPITSVVIPIEEMCNIAWEMLLNRIADPQSPLQQRTLLPHLEVRASSNRSSVEKSEMESLITAH